MSHAADLTTISYRELDRLVHLQVQELESRGYRQVSRIHAGEHWCRRLVRRFLGSAWGGRRTYFTCLDPSGVRSFVKVYLGGRDHWSTKILGSNEALLADYFASKLDPVPGIRSVELIDHWAVGHGYCVVLRWADMEGIDLLAALADESLRSRLAGLCRALRHLSPPPEWSLLREPFDRTFAGKGHRALEAASPVNVDLGQNLALDRAGNLVFHDFEKTCWTDTGLQELLLVTTWATRAQRLSRRVDAAFLETLVHSFRPEMTPSLLARAARIVDTILQAGMQAPLAVSEWDSVVSALGAASVHIDARPVDSREALAVVESSPSFPCKVEP